MNFLDVLRVRSLERSFDCSRLRPPRKFWAKLSRPKLAFCPPWLTSEASGAEICFCSSAGGRGGGDEGGFWARTVLSLSYLGGDKCPVAFISQSKRAEVLIMHSLVFQFSSETICLMSDDQQSNRLGHDEK